MRRFLRWLARVAALVVLALGALALWLYSRYGGGRPYPDLSGPPLLPDTALEVVVSSPEPIGNVAVDAAGRVFYTLHPESRPTGPKLWVAENGSSRPFPDLATQERLFQTPLGVAVDSRGLIWAVDHGFHGFGTPRLVAFTAAGALAHDYPLPRDIAPRGSFLQDLSIDAVSGTVFVADVSFFGRRPAIVVIAAETGAARRVLESHPSVLAQDWILRTPAREMQFFGGIARLKVGVDGIAAARDGSFLAYGAMTHDTLYRVPIAALLDPTLPAAALASQVQAIGPKPLNDGLTTDIAGNVLVTDVEHGAVIRIAPDGRRETLVRSARIRWADDLSYGPGDWVYLADSAIPEQMLRSKRHIRASAPYFIFRFRAGIDGIPGG